jgi:hypothetical protein
VSSFEVAITVTVAVLGTVVGAVYNPVVSIEPHPGEQLVAVGEMTLVAVACASSQVTSLGVASLVSVAWNWKDEPVATVAVAGVTVTRIPESRVIVAVPVFFLLAFEVAVIVIVGGGLGTLAGAV